MARGGTRKRKAKARPPLRTVILALVGLAVLLFWRPAFVWLSTWPPEAAQRAEAIARLSRDFPISAIDSTGAEIRLRWSEVTGIAQGPCSRDLSLSAADGIGRHGLIQGRIVILCHEDLQHATQGGLHAVIRYDVDPRDGSRRATAVGGEELAAAVAGRPG